MSQKSPPKVNIDKDDQPQFSSVVATEGRRNVRLHSVSTDTPPRTGPNPLAQLVRDWLDTHPDETVTSLARKAGLTQQHLHRIVDSSRTHQSPELLTITQLATATGIPLSVMRDVALRSSPLASDKLRADSETEHISQNALSIARRIEALDAERQRVVRLRLASMEWEQSQSNETTH
jgi:transcriptional regulator with XRE-family HTH domain